MAKNIQRPQLKFKDKVDNSNTPFIPIIKRKPNALRPLEISKFASVSFKFVSLIATVLLKFTKSREICERIPYQNLLSMSA